MSPSDAEGPEPGEGAEPRRGGGGGEASEKQRNFIASLQKRIGLTDDELAAVLKDVAGVEAPEDLDRRQASEVIDELMTTARDKGVDLDAQPKASEKQVGFMKSLKRRAHLTDDEFRAFLEERAGVSTPEEVGKRDASVVIDELLARANAGGAPKGGAAPKGRGRAPAGGGAPGTSVGSSGASGDGAPAKRPRKAAPKRAAPAAPAFAPAPAAGPDDDDRPPDKAPPPPPWDDEAEPGSFADGPDDADLDRDPGPEEGPPDGDLPF